MEEYVLVVLPPKDVADFVDTFRQKFAKYTQYKIPPHITIYPPFHHLFETEGLLRAHLAQTFVATKPQRISLRGVGSFEGKNNVVFLEPSRQAKGYLLDLVQKTDASLSGKVEKAFKNYDFSPVNFNPHMTIAEHIPDEELSKIKTDLEQEDIRVAFLVNSLHLFKKTDNNPTWRQFTQIRF